MIFIEQVKETNDLPFAKEIRLVSYFGYKPHVLKRTFIQSSVIEITTFLFFIFCYSCLHKVSALRGLQHLILCNTVSSTAVLDGLPKF